LPYGERVPGAATERRNYSGLKLTPASL
jgi:hypothetical protein